MLSAASEWASLYNLILTNFLRRFPSSKYLKLHAVSCLLLDHGSIYFQWNCWISGYCISQQVIRVFSTSIFFTELNWISEILNFYWIESTIDTVGDVIPEKALIKPTKAVLLQEASSCQERSLLWPWHLSLVCNVYTQYTHYEDPVMNTIYFFF